MSSWADMAQAAHDSQTDSFDPFPALSTAKATKAAAASNNGAAVANTSTKVFTAKRKMTNGVPTNGTQANGASASQVNATVTAAGSQAKSTAELAQKDGHIKELEGEIAKKDMHVRELVSQLDEKDRHAAQMEQDFEGQKKAYAGLVAQMDEKDRRITVLEQDLAVYRVRTADLERQVEALKSHPFVAVSQDGAPEDAAKNPSADDSAPVIIEGAVEDTEEDATDDCAGASSPSSEDTAQNTAETFVDGPTENNHVESKEKDAAPIATTKAPSGPIVETHAKDTDTASDIAVEAPAAPVKDSQVKETDAASATPVKSSPSDISDSKAAEETDAVSTAAVKSSPGPVIDATLPDLPNPPKKSAMDVKPAPKLTFPIKNGGKIDKGKSTTAWATKTATNIGKSAFSAGIYDKDMREMPMTERNELFRGPAISVIIGTQQIRGIPKHMFMVVSPRVRQYFEKNPNETYIPFAAGEVTKQVMELLKDYFRNMGSHKNVYSLKLRGNMAQDLIIRHDCIFLGMDKYVAHFTRIFCDKVRDSFIGFESIALIERHTTDDDNLWECLCNNLASMRVRGALPEGLKFDKFLEAHPRLAQAIARIDTRLRIARIDTRLRIARGNITTNAARAPSSTPSTTRARGRPVNARPATGTAPKAPHPKSDAKTPRPASPRVKLPETKAPRPKTPDAPERKPADMKSPNAKSTIKPGSKVAEYEAKFAKAAPAGAKGNGAKSPTLKADDIKATGAKSDSSSFTKGG